MSQGDDILAAIAHIHAAGLDAEKWPQALSWVTKLIGGHGASLEIIEKPSLRHSGFFSYGLPAVGAYLEHYAPMCPRLPYAARAPAGTIQYDALYIDEDAMNANPFYAEFLAGYDMRYFLGGVVARSPKDVVLSGVQIPPKHGHPTPAKIKMMGVLLPHIQQATDVMRRLGALSKKKGALERALDWLVDGVIVLGMDGAVHYANIAAQEIFRADDGIAVNRGALTLASREATARLGEAMKAIRDLCGASLREAAPSDFAVERRSGISPYSMSVRPYTTEAGKFNAEAVLIFIRDPARRKMTDAVSLGRVFGLTPAEAEVASALCSGLSPDEYARQNDLSSNTVYTHIRRLKEKTGSKRMAELIRKLNDAQSSAVVRVKE